jgi:hypothetical protein
VNLFFVISGCILLVTFAFFIRVKPIWKTRYRGVDTYYFLLCAEEFKRNRKIPIVLPPYYLLDIQEQWYPPGLTVFLSLFSERFVKKYYWILNPAVDCLIVALLYVLTYLVTLSMPAAILAGFLYALTPAAIVECSSLASRPLGCLFLIATMLSTFAFANNHSPYFLGVCLLSGFCLLMTHKMSAQLLYFVLPLMSLVFWDSTYILVMLGIVAITLLLSKGFFIKMLRGQYDILSFWNRNWGNLGAHQVYSSPIYGDEARDDRGRVFQRGFKGLYQHFRFLGLNIFVVLLVFPLLHYQQLSLFDQQMLWWVILTYVLAVLTLLIPQFRFFGEGFKYLTMAAFPISYLATTTFYYGWDIDYYFYPLLTVAILASIWLVLRVYKSVSSTSGANPSMDSDLASIVRFLKENDKVSAIQSVPQHLVNMITYHCRKKVLWGAHSYNFRAVEPLFPVYRQPLDFFVSTYNISHIVVDTDYVPPKLLKLSPKKRVFSAGRYEIYEVLNE